MRWLNIDNFRQTIGSRLWRLYYGIKRAILKKNISLQQRCFLLVDFEIRAANPTLLQLGEIEDDDGVVEYVSRYLMERPQIESSIAAATKNSEKVAGLIENYSNSSELKYALSVYFLSRAYTASVIQNSEERDEFLGRAKKSYPAAEEFKGDDVFKKYSDVNRRIKSLRKSLAERSAVKFDVNSAHITGFLSVAPALMLVVGVVYTNTLLAHFGVNASLFFSIGDYLATSVDQLQSIAISVCLSFATYIAGIRDSSLRSRMELNELAKRDKKPYLLLLVVIAAATGQVVSAYRGEHESGSLIFLACFLSSAGARYIASKYLKNSFQGEAVLMAVFVFASYSAVRCMGEIHDLQSEKWGARERVKVVAKKETNIDTGDLVVIRSNSSYVFAINKKTRQMEIVPKDQISEFVVSLMPEIFARETP